MPEMTGDLSEFFDPDLHLTIRGVRYTIPTESADDGIRIRQVTNLGGFTEAEEQTEALKRLGAQWVEKIVERPIFIGAVQQFDTESQLPLLRQVTIGHWEGGVYQQMADNGLSIEEILHAGTTALMKTAFGTERAEEFWSQALNNRAIDAEGKAEPPQSGALAAPKAAPRKAAPRKAGPKPGTRRSAKKTAPRKTAKKAAPRKAT